MTALSKEENRLIQLDRMRYTKNSLSSSLTYLAILFDVLYFVSIYESDVGNWYYNHVIGISVVYNLLFMLIAFLSSEGVKNYKLSYSVVLLALGAGQIARIFYLPMRALSETITRMDPATKQKVTVSIMEKPQFTWVVVCLAVSALCCFAAGAIGVYRSRTLAAYQATLDEQAA